MQHANYAHERDKSLVSRNQEFQCGQCGITFNLQDRLEQHVKIHDGYKRDKSRKSRKEDI